MVTNQSKINIVLFGFFFFTCWALGYSTLNRYSPHLFEGLSDAAIYYNIVENGIQSIEYDLNNRSSRLLVPLLARLLYLILPAIGSWDPISHSILITTSIFTSLSALLIFNLSLKKFNNINLSIIASFIYITNFCVINFYLAGLIDSAWSLCCLILIYLLYNQKFYLLPFLSVFATLIKEHYLLFGSLIILLWLIYEFIYEKKVNYKNIFYFFLSTLISLLIVISIYYILRNQLTMPWQIIEDVPALQNTDFTFNYLMSRLSRLVMVIGPLLLLSIPNIKMFDRKILFVISLVLLIQIIFGSIISIGGAGHGRQIFNIASYILCTSSAMTLYNIINSYRK